MNLKSFLPALGAMPIAGICAAERPNVVLIYIDDMGISDIGAYGGDFVPTPNIDRLATDGILFQQYYSAAPVSSASRCALTTGNFHSEHGITTFLSARKHNARCEQYDYLDANAPSMFRAFQQAGYKTAHIGKWHLGGGRDVKNAPSIKEYGFDEYLSTYESPDADPQITATNWIWSDKDPVKRWDRTEYFVDKSIDFIERSGRAPFFLNLWLDDMHTPWVPSDKFKAKKTHASEPAFKLVLAELDLQIGRLIEALDQRGLSENTIVIFTSDNGPMPSFGRRRTAGLRGTKNCLYEGGIRMPFIVKYPAEIAPGTVNENSVLCAVDMYPTLCAIAGVKTEKHFDGDGKNYSKVLLGKSHAKRKKDLIWDFGRNQYFNKPEKKEDITPHLAIRSGDWKLLVNADGSDVRLYNLATDVKETTNVAAENEKITKKLSAKVIDWYMENKVNVNTNE